MIERPKVGGDGGLSLESQIANLSVSQSITPSFPQSLNPSSPQAPDSRDLASSTVNDLEGPWILLKVKALGEHLPAAGQHLEEELDALRTPNEISAQLRREFGVRLSELEISRYGAWLPHIRRDALRKAEEQAERNVQEAKERMKRRRK